MTLQKVSKSSSLVQLELKENQTWEFLENVEKLQWGILGRGLLYQTNPSSVVWSGKKALRIYEIQKK